MPRDFENREIARIVGVNPRTVIDWTERGLVASGVRAADGAGTRRRYSEHDLVRLAIVKTLLGDGIPRKVVRQALEMTREFSRTDTLFSLPPGAENPFALWTEIEAFVSFYLVFDLRAQRMELGLVRKAGQPRNIRIGAARKELANPEESFAELGKKALSMGRAYVLNLSAVKADVRAKMDQ